MKATNHDSSTKLIDRVKTFFQSQNTQPEAEVPVKEHSPIRTIIDRTEEKLIMNILDTNSRNTSIFSKGLELVGDVNVDGNIIIEGTITGNIEINGDVTIKDEASIEGSVTAHNITLESGIIKGAVAVKDAITLSESSQIQGDIRTGKIMSSGNIVGNIQASDTVTLSSYGAVEGDIEASSISIEHGASIIGRVQIVKSHTQPSPTAMRTHIESASFDSITDFTKIVGTMDAIRPVDHE